MFDSAGFDSVDDFVSNGKDRAMAKASRNGAAAIDAGEVLVFCIAAEFQGFFDDRCEVFVFADMSYAVKGNDFRREDAVDVGFTRRHEAVRREQECAGNAIEFFLLVLPSRTEVAFEVFVFLQFRISVSREHFAVRIDIDAFAFSLFEEEFQVFQVVAGDNDERAFFNRQRNRRRNRSTISRRISFIEESHAGQVDFACFHDNREEFIHAPVFADGRQAFDEESIDFFARFAKHESMISISSHAAHTKEDERFEGTDIFVSVPHLVHIVVSCGSGRKSSGFSVNFIDHSLGRRRVEVDVGNGREHAFEDSTIGLSRRSGILTGAGQANEGAGQNILQSGFNSRFATNTGTTGTASTHSGLFTLETKHLFFFCHGENLLYFIHIIN